MPLTALGFTHGEVTRAARTEPADGGPDARLLAPARLERHRVEFLVDTGATEGIVLDATYVRRAGLPALATPDRPFALLGVEEYGVAALAELRTPLGTVKATAAGPAAVRYAAAPTMSGLNPAMHRRPFVGVLGAAPLGACVLGVDARRAEIAVSRRPDLVPRLEREAGARGARRLRVVDAPNTWSPITDDPDAPPLPGNGPGVWLLDTGARWSVLGTEYTLPVHAAPTPLAAPQRTAAGLVTTEAAWSLDWGGRRVDTLLPGGPLAPFAAQAGVPRVDGILGMDLLGQWLLVFDLARHRVLLFDHD